MDSPVEGRNMVAGEDNLVDHRIAALDRPL